MRATKRDFFAIAAAVLLAAVLVIASTGGEKAGVVPADDTHRPFNEAMKKGSDSIETEKACTICHNPQAHPLPKKHPPKEQCLICHKPSEVVLQ